MQHDRLIQAVILVKTLGVRNVQLWSLEAAKDVKKCKYKNPEKNKFCSLFQTILFLPINNSFKHIVWKRIEQTLLGYPLSNIAGRQKRICLK